MDVIEAGFAISSPGELRGRPRRRRRRSTASSPRSRARTTRTSTRPSSRCRARATRASTSSSPRRDIHLRAQAAHDPRRRCSRRPTGRCARRRGSAPTSSSRPRTRPAPTPTSWPRSCGSAIAAGATTINIPDTVGYTRARGVRARSCNGLRERVPERRRASSSRCTATTTSAWPWPTRSPASCAGARQVECTINGIGERAGNASLEEIVMALQTRARPRSARTRTSTPRRSTARQPAGLAAHGLSPCSPTRRSSAQRLRPRGGHPPGRRAQEPRAPTRS